MRLTNVHREAFVRAVIADVPLIDYDEQIRKIVHEDAISALPAAVREIAREPMLQMFLNKEYFHSETRLMPSVMVYASGRGDYKMSESAKQKVEALLKLMKSQEKIRFDLREKLQATIAACSTRKIALERLPEFEKYLPSDVTSGSRDALLPAIANLVTDLAAAGWPKGKQATAAV